MKNIIKIFIWIIASFLLVSSTFATNCSYDVDSDPGSIAGRLDDCLESSALVDPSWDLKADGGFWNQLRTWTNNIAIYLWIFAVFAIAYGSLQLTLSAGEDEKIKKAKDIVKWWMLWFLWVIFASAIINLVVKLMYSL